MQPSTAGIRLPGITGNSLEFTLAGEALSSKGWYLADRQGKWVTSCNFAPLLSFHWSPLILENIKEYIRYNIVSQIKSRVLLTT